MRVSKTSFTAIWIVTLLGCILLLTCCKGKQYNSLAIQDAGIAVFFHDTERIEYIMPFPDWVPDRLGLYNAKKWPKDKREFKIQFVNGDQDIYTRTLQDWNISIGKLTGLKFTQVATKPDLIVSFTANNQAWSYVGKDAGLIAAQGQVTMNLGWHIRYRENQQGERFGTGVHEMMHTLGYIHTLQSPAAAGKLVWNKEVVYAKYARMGWSRQMVDQQVFNLYTTSQVTDHAWDPTSIMAYSISPGEANIVIGRNNALSGFDISKLQADYATGPITAGLSQDSLLSCFRPARQSTNYNSRNSYPASNAFDCRNQPLHGANFSQTGLELNPWIEVDLQANYQINQIDVINRMDNQIAKSRLKRFRLFVSNSPLTELPISGEVAAYNQASPALDSIKYQVNTNGRYVRLWMEWPAANYLSVSEIRAWGQPSQIVCRDTIYRVQVVSFRDSVVRICDTLGL